MPKKFKTWRLKKTLKTKFRDINCGELRLADVEKFKNTNIKLTGWIQTIRKFGSITLLI